MSYPMGRVLILITQLRNLTHYRVGFRVPRGLHPLRILPSGRTRSVKQHRILRFCRENGPHWTVGVLIDGNYTGVELSSSHVLKYARIIFRYVENGNGENVLVVDGIEENPSSDYFLRLKYFGWMRNIFWDKRPSVEIARSDSRVATKLRGIEAPVTKLKRRTASPAREAEKLTRKLPLYSSTVLENESNVCTSVSSGLSFASVTTNSSRLSFDSVNTNEEKLETNNVRDSDVMDKSRDNFKMKTNTDGKLNHVNNAVPPPQPRRRDEGIPLPLLPNINGLMEYPNNYMDEFVYGILFVFALLFVVFVRVSIG